MVIKFTPFIMLPLCDNLYPKRRKHMPHQISSEICNCIDNCLECHTICTETINHCLKKGNEHSDSKHINILLDCAKICQTSEDFMLRTSNLHPKTCDVCAQACKNCAESCKKMAKH